MAWATSIKSRVTKILFPLFCIPDWAGHSIALLLSHDQTIHGIDQELFIADTSVVLPLVFTPCDRVHIIRSLAAKHESRIANHRSRITKFNSQRTGDDMSFAEWLDV